MSIIKKPLQVQSNVSPQFHVLETAVSKLFYRGSINTTWEAVLNSLEQGDFPKQVRGNFAFIFQDKNGTVAAVDHVCSIPLYYSKNQIGHVYSEVCKQEKCLTKNPAVEVELLYLGGFSFLNNETLYKEVRRLQPGHYLKKGKQHKYISIEESEGDKILEPDHLRELLQNALVKRLGKKNVLLTSSGTDSLTITAIIKKLDLLEKFDFLTLYVDYHHTSEIELTESIYKEMNIPLHSFKVQDSNRRILDQEVAERTHSFWPDLHYASKRFAISKCGYSQHTIFTGEVGDQNFGGPKLSVFLPYVMQAQRVDPREIAKLWIHLSSRSFGASINTTPYIESLFKQYPEGKEVYLQLVEKIAQLFLSFKTRDLPNRLMMMNLIIKGPFRVWPYSQDTLNFEHPLADWDLIRYTLSLKSKFKVYNNGTLKQVLYDLWRDYVPEVAWKKPKSGPRIPDSARIRY